LKKPDIDRWDVLIVLGMGLISLGVALIYEPLGPMALGVMILTIGVMGAFRT